MSVLLLDIALLAHAEGGLNLSDYRGASLNLWENYSILSSICLLTDMTNIDDNICALCILTTILYCAIISIVEKRLHFGDAASQP